MRLCCNRTSRACDFVWQLDFSDVILELIRISSCDGDDKSISLFFQQKQPYSAVLTNMTLLLPCADMSVFIPVFKIGDITSCQYGLNLITVSFSDSVRGISFWSKSLYFWIISWIPWVGSVKNRRPNIVASSPLQHLLFPILGCPINFI